MFVLIDLARTLRSLSIFVYYFFEKKSVNDWQEKNYTAFKADEKKIYEKKSKRLTDSKYFP